MNERRMSVVSPKDLQFWESYDHYNVDNPHVGDPRNLQHTQWNYCRLRYALFCRCCKELDEDNPRCKYQYYRAEMACTQDFLDLANKGKLCRCLTEHPSIQFEAMNSSHKTVVKSVSLFKGSNGRPKLSLARQNSLNWHIAELAHQERIIMCLKWNFGMDWEAAKNAGYWGVNSTTHAIESNEDVALVVLFKGNVCNSMIQHIPHACCLKNIPFVSIVKKVVPPPHIPVKNISVLALKLSSQGIGDVSDLLMYYSPM